MPTRDCRTQLRFRLDLVLAGASPGAGPDLTEIVQVLASVWAWIFFGGLGARTRRGFGALELSEPPVLNQFQGLDTAIWNGLFAGPSENRPLDWLQAFQRAASPRGGAWPFEILVGGPVDSASQAHGEIIDRMRYFRQEPGFARESGNPRPGQSRWPEPHLLRTLAPPGGPFAHKPPAGMAERVAAGEVGAPRAAFGLPIQVKFKDQGDQRADATLLPPGAGRWPSPLLLRPLRCASGKYRPAAVILPFLPPEKVEVKYGNHAQTSPEASVLKHAGARDPIARLLTTHHGNALQAFAAWLEGSSYRRISLPKPGGPPYA